jgi:anti-sigma B factor antagonist
VPIVSDAILEVSVAPGDSPVVITAVGDLDYGSTGILREAAMKTLDEGRLHLVLDLSGLAICDSTGLSLFVDLHRKTTRRGGWVRLAGPGRLLVSTLAITSLDRLLPIYPTVDAALKASL